jgi:uncharacterized membrane protein
MDWCPSCKEDVDFDDRFCRHCGQKLREAPSRPATSPEFKTLEVEDYQDTARHYLKAGWELFKQEILGFIGFSFLVLLIHLALYYCGWFGLLLFFLLSPLWAGFLVVSTKLYQQQQRAQYRDFFAGFHYFLPLVLFNLVGGALVLLGVCLLVLPGIYLTVSYTFATLLILDRRLNFWTAMESSRKMVQRNWARVFSLLIVLWLINLAGVLLGLGIMISMLFFRTIPAASYPLLLLGLVVTIPWSYCAITIAYADLFGIQTGISGREGQ